MNGHLLDTNVFSELTRPAPDPNVAAFISTHHDLWLASIVVYELEFGLILLPPGQRRNRQSLANERIMALFTDRVLPLTKTGAESAARFRAYAQQRGRSIELADALIAGTAAAHDLTVVTRNVRHFEELGVEIIDPWQVVAG